MLTMDLLRKNMEQKKKWDANILILERSKFKIDHIGVLLTFDIVGWLKKTHLKWWHKIVSDSSPSNIWYDFVISVNFIL